MAGIETVGQRPLMPPELLKAAIVGNARVLKKMLGLGEDGGHTSVAIEPAAYVEIDKNLKSATFMGNTVLHVLCANNHGKLASKVCKKDGSLLRARNKMLETPLHYAAKGIVNWKSISALIKFAHSKGGLILKEVLRDRNHHGETALHVIARYAAYTLESIINKMLEGDPELACHVDNDGISPLNVAMAKGYFDGMCRAVIQNSNNQRILSRICCSQAKQPSALHINIESAEIFQKEIEVPTSAGIIGSSLIHIAASTNCIEGVEKMLDLDASLAYLQDSDGLFPVHVAAYKGHVLMVRLFMRRCLDFGELVDHRERNFLHIAAEENKSNIFAWLFETSHTDSNINPSSNTILGRMINTGDSKGNTPLHIAASKGYISLMMKMKDIMGSIKCEAAPVRNRKGLSVFAVSVIQVKAQARNSLEMQELIGEHLETYGESFNSNWFDTVMAFRADTIKVMPTVEGNGSSMTDQLQIIGLGAVLITTVAFAAAFTFPGGYNTNGSPVLAGKYLFKAFMLAITLAFLQSFFCVLMLMIGGLSPIDRPARGIFLAVAMYLFSGGARCMVLSFGLGLYLVLAPAHKGIGILILLLTISSVMLDITPKFLSSIVLFINGVGEQKEDIIIFFARDHPRILTFFRMLRFILPFVFVFIFSFVP